jgi:hypothetical protein
VLVGFGFYNAGTHMTAKELWDAVGQQLLLRRTRLGLDPSKTGGPNYHTIAKIEAGEIGRVEKVEEYAAALGLSIVDVLRAVLYQNNLTPETEQIVRKYRRTTVAGRQALLSMAQALPDDEAAPPMPHQPPADPDR